MADAIREEVDEYVTVGGLRLRVSVRGPALGARPPLLLCNGLGASLELWEPFRRALGSDVTSIAFDAPGVGASEVPSLPPTLRSIAGTTMRMLDALGIGRVDVLGISWGGHLAQEMARRHPMRVRRLVLVATNTGWASIPGDPRAMAILATPLRLWSPSYLARVAPTLYGGEFRQDPGLVRRYRWLRHAHPASAKGYAWQLLAGRRWTSRPWLHRLTQPTLVLAGDDDPLTPLANAKLLARRIPDARLHVIEGGGHVALLSRAAELAPVVKGFLEPSA
jgi:poly(3-hydroxyoctanoate) depolymerase